MEGKNSASSSGGSGRKRGESTGNRSSSGCGDGGTSGANLVGESSDIEDYDEDMCSLCSDIQEILERPHSSTKDLLNVELSHSDAMAVYRFFEKRQDHRNCQIFGERYWDIHRLLRTFIVQVTIPLLNTLLQDCEALMRCTNFELAESEEEFQESFNEEIIQDLDLSEPGTPRLRHFSIDERTILISFSAQAFSEDFMLYRCVPRETRSDERQGNPLPLLVKCSIEHRILDIMESIFEEGVHVIPVRMASALLKIAIELRRYVQKTPVIRRQIQEIRKKMIKYLCSMSEDNQEMIRDLIFRGMSDSLWMMGREEMMDEGRFTLDQSGVLLAVKHCDSPYLASRIAGLNQICHYIQLLNDCLTKENLSSCEKVTKTLGSILRNNNVVNLVFGPNTHPELVRQAFPFLDFMANWSMLSQDSIDCIWSAAQKKDCSKHVFELLSLTVKNMNPAAISYLHTILQEIKSSEQNDMTLSLTHSVIEMQWRFTTLRNEHLKHISVVVDDSASKSVDQSGDSGDTTGESGDSEDYFGARCDMMDDVVSSDEEEEDEEDEEDIMFPEDDESLELKQPSHHFPPKELGISDDLAGLANGGADGDSGSDTSSPLSPLTLTEKKPVGAERKSPKSAQISPSSSSSIENRENSSLKRPSTTELSGSGDSEAKKLKLDGAAETRFRLSESTPKRRIGEEENSRQNFHANLNQSPVLSRFPSETVGVSPLLQRVGVHDEGANRILLERIMNVKNMKGRGARSLEDMSSDRATSSGGRSDRMVDLEEEEDDDELDGMNLSDGVVIENELLTTSCNNSSGILTDSRSFGRSGGVSCVDGNIQPQRMFHQQGISLNMIRACTEDSGLPVMDLANLASPGVTILWDLLMQENTDDSLGVEEERLAIKHLLDLCCMFPAARMQFIIACVENLKRNRSPMVSLQLLPRLVELDTAKTPRSPESDARKSTSELLQYLNTKYNLMDAFFGNVKLYFDSCKDRDEETKKYSHSLEVQARIKFLDFVCGLPFQFSELSYLHFFKMEQFGVLWKCMMEDKTFGRQALCQWLLCQLKRSDKQGTLSEMLTDIILSNRMSDFEPEYLLMTELSLIQVLLQYEQLGDSKECLNLLWGVSLKNVDTNVSMSAMQALSSYYVSSSDPKDAAKKEEEFVRLCTEHLERALNDSHFEKTLPIINRALVVLKSHLETFKKRFSFHLRLRELEEKAAVLPHHRNSHMERGSVITIYFQTASGEKNELTVSMGSTLGELRADISHWWRSRTARSSHHILYRTTNWKDAHTSGPPPNVTITSKGIPEASTTQLLGALLADAQLRLIHNGRELNHELDEAALLELGIRDGSMILVALSSSKAQSGGWLVKGIPQPPDSEFTPMKLLLAPDRWNLLMRVVDELLARTDAHKDKDLRIQCLNLARRAWEVILLLPTCPKFLSLLEHTLLSENAETEESKGRWTGLLDDKRKHQLLYALQILEPRLVGNQKMKASFAAKGGAQHLLKILLTDSLCPPKKDWNEWDLECLTSILRIIYCCSYLPDDTGRTIHWQSSPKKELRFPVDATTSLLDIAVFDGVDHKVLVAMLQKLISQLCEDRNCCFHFALALRLNALLYGFMLLTSLLYTEPALQTVFVQYGNFKDWLKQLTFQSSESSLRHECVRLLYTICLGRSPKKLFAGKNMIVPVLTGLLSVLEEAASLPPLMPDEDSLNKKEESVIKEPYGQSSYSYFFLVTQLVEGLKRADVEFPMSLLDVAESAKNLLIARPIYEENDGGVPDPVLRGLVMLLTAIAKLHPQWKSSEIGKFLCSEVWSMIFRLPTIGGKEPKSKTSETREVAYDLLAELCRGSVTNYMTVYQYVTEQNSKSYHDDYGWDYWPRDQKRSTCGFVGLANLGATCYMATALQHLYMIPEFRGAVLSCEPEPNQKHETTLIELQRLFTFLNRSERKAYSPRTFCKVYHMDNEPMNTGEQKDMTEFFTDLITKTEEMSPKLKKMVKQLFCGVMSNNVVSDSCPHVSKTTEDFYTVRCQVANMKNIYASLDELTVADILEGDNMYTCSQCDRKVKAKKRACFKQLPQILSFNTMRYTFNMVTMMKEKVNTHFSFPHRLNMKPYMEETLLPSHAARRISEEDGSGDGKDESYEYQLIGVTVHTGTAEGGHYYSYIRDPEDPENWYSFNDAEVKLWDPGNLAGECFGGEMIMPRHYDGHLSSDRNSDMSYEKANSAYMVFYSRVPMNQEVCMDITDGSHVKLSEDLEKWIWEDNAKFIQDLMIFDHQYFSFVHQMCSEIPATLNDGALPTSELACKTTQLSIRFVLETLIHAKEKPTIHTWMELLLKQLSGCQDACQWFLETMIGDSTWPLELLIKCPASGCRQLFEKLICHVFFELHEKHVALFLDGIQHFKCIEEAEADSVGQGSCVTRFIHVLLKLLQNPEVQTEVRQLTEYFSLLLTFAKGGDIPSKFLLMAGTLRTVIEFYMTKTTQELAEFTDPDDLLSQSDDGDLGGLLSLVKSATISRSLWLSPALEKMIDLIIVLLETSRNEDGQLILHKGDRMALFGSSTLSFLMQQVKDAANMKTAARLLMSVSKDRPTMKEKLVEVIFANIEKNPREDQAMPFFHVLSELCAMNGETLTTNDFLGLIVSNIWSLADRRTVSCLSWLETNAATCPRLYNYLLSNLDYWVKKYILLHPNAQARTHAGQLLLSLIPAGCVRTTYLHYHRMSSAAQPRAQSVPAEAMSTLHRVYEFLLSLIPFAMDKCGSPNSSLGRLVSYFTAMRACLIGRDEKIMLVPYFCSFWNYYKKHLHGCHIKVIPNKQAIFMFWYFASMDCPEMVQAAMKLDDVIKQFFFSYIVVESDRDTVCYNKQYLTALYGLTRMFCANSEKFCKEIMKHENMKFAVQNVLWKTGDYPKASDDIIGIIEQCCKVKDQEAVKDFKQKMIWPLMKDIMKASPASNFLIVLKVSRFLVETPEDKMFLLENDVMNILSDILIRVHTMYHEATACNVIGDVSEMLKRMEDFLMRVEQCAAVKGKTAISDKILKNWTKQGLVGVKLLELLNSYVPPAVRVLSMNCLCSMFRLLYNDQGFMTDIIEVVILSHKRWLSGAGCNPNLGPYFPKRGYIPDPGMKVHPPEPMLDMTLSSMQLEASKGVDRVYDSELSEYFLPYHQMIDQLVRSAMFNKEFKDVAAMAELSTLIGMEGVLLQFTIFPKKWLAVKQKNDEASGDDKPMQQWLDALYKVESFVEFLCLVLSEEQCVLENRHYCAFFKAFYTNVVDQRINPNMKRRIGDNVRDSLNECLANWDEADDTRRIRFCRKISGVLRIIELMVEYFVIERMKTDPGWVEPLQQLNTKLYTRKADSEEATEVLKNTKTLLKGTMELLDKFVMDSIRANESPAPNS